MLYIALIGDIIDSKKIKERAQAQQDLLILMEDLNQQYSSYLLSPLTVTTGDEFQALLKPNPDVFQMIDQISLSFPYENEIRFGLGIGEMLTDINRDLSIGSDGPAYWRAREAINYIHDKNDYGSSRLAVATADEAINQTVNAILAASSFIQSKWTKSQYAIFRQLLSEGIYDETFSHKKIAELLKVNPSAFNKRLKASGLKIYLRNKRAAMDLLLKAAEEEENVE